jgi:peptide/nickel transport system substrate-binding protein
MAGYWEKFTTERVGRRRALQIGAIGGTSLAALALVGCGSDESGSTPSSAPTPAQSVAANPGHSSELAPQQVVRRRITQELIPLDPATIFRISSEEIAFNVYSALATYDANSPEVVPDAAESWEVSDDGLTLSFKIRKGMKWHKDYGELTAEDVVYSYKRVLEPATGSSYTSNFAGVDQIQSPDPSTVVIKLKAPDANFFHQVANYHQGAIVNRKAIESLGADYGFKPVGTGPFIFASYTPGQETVLERFPQYYKGAATLEKVILRRIADNETAAIALQNEEIDILGSISNEQTYARLEADDRVFVRQTPTVGHVSNGIFNANTKPLDDVRVRKAMYHAVDRDAVVAAVAPINGRVWNNIIPSWMPEANADVPTFAYDPAEAKALLSAAGASSGLSFKFLHTQATEELQFYLDYWSKVGIKVEFELVDEPTFVTRRAAADYVMTYRGLPSINPDDMLFGYFHSKYHVPTGYNAAKLSNPKVDSALEKARAEFDTEKRIASYKEAQALAMADAPYMPHNHNRRIDINLKWIDPAESNPLTNMLFYPMKVYKKG